MGFLIQDFQPQVNMLLEYTSQKDEILIKQGTPLAVHIPYKKEEYEIGDRNVIQKTSTL